MTDQLNKDELGENNSLWILNEESSLQCDLVK